MLPPQQRKVIIRVAGANPASHQAESRVASTIDGFLNLLYWDLP